MSVLFDTDEAGAVVVAPGRPDAKVIQALEGYGYKRDVVRTWTPEKANTVLRSCRREERIALRRAAAVAGQQDDSAPRGKASTPERLEAAKSIEQEMGHGEDALCQAVMYTVGNLHSDELKRLAGYLVRLFRGENQ